MNNIYSVRNTVGQFLVRSLSYCSLIPGRNAYTPLPGRALRMCASPMQQPHSNISPHTETADTKILSEVNPYMQEGHN